MKYMIIDSGGAFVYNSSLQKEQGECIVFWPYGTNPLKDMLYVKGWAFITSKSWICEEEYGYR